MSQSRREFLIHLASITVLTQIPLMPVNFALSVDATSEDLLIKVGQAFLNQGPNLKKLDDFSQKLNSLDNKSKLEFLKQSIEDDYANNRYFTYDHWILSQTEGQLCALIRK